MNHSVELKHLIFIFGLIVLIACLFLGLISFLLNLMSLTDIQLIVFKPWIIWSGIATVVGFSMTIYNPEEEDGGNDLAGAKLI